MEISYHTFRSIIFDRDTTSIDLEPVLRVGNIRKRNPVRELISNFKLRHIAVYSLLIGYTARYKR